MSVTAVINTTPPGEALCRHSVTWCLDVGGGTRPQGVELWPLGPH